MENIGLSEYSWVVGAPFPDCICCAKYNEMNPDHADQRYTKKFGCYGENVGLDACLLAWTGPEYVYQVLKRGNCSIPKEGLAMLRYYPLEPWHSGKAYRDLCSDEDRERLSGVQRFDSSRRKTLRSVTNKKRSLDLDHELKGLLEIVGKYVGPDLEW